MVGALLLMAAPAHASELRVDWSGRRPRMIDAVDTGRRVVALSFDDGPDPRFTPRVLDLLTRFGAHATFFDVGKQVAAHPDLARRTVAAGNEIGNHTWDHPHLDRLTTEQTAGELAMASTAFAAAGVPEASLFRSPFGEYAAHNEIAVQATGKRVVGWDLCVERYLHHHAVAEAVDAMMERVQPGDIILAHDARLNRARTMRALPLLLDQLRRRGYRIVTVSQLLRVSST